MASNDSRGAGRHAAAGHPGTYDLGRHREDGDTRQSQDGCVDAPVVQIRRQLRITGRRGKEKLFRPGAHRQGPDGILTRFSSPGLESNSATPVPTLYNVVRPDPLSAIHHGVAGPETSPQALTMLGSGWSAGTNPSETRLCWV